MTTIEIKSEIQKVIDNFPEAVLEEVLQNLKQVQKANFENVETSIHLGQILREDKLLLEKPAH